MLFPSLNITAPVLQSKVCLSAIEALGENRGTNERQTEDKMAEVILRCFQQTQEMKKGKSEDKGDKKKKQQSAPARQKGRKHL